MGRVYHRDHVRGLDEVVELVEETSDLSSARLTNLSRTMREVQLKRDN